MRNSDWSSDVCSSDLEAGELELPDTTVAVTLSSGTCDFPMPNVTNSSKRAAINDLVAAGTRRKNIMIRPEDCGIDEPEGTGRSEEHTSELQPIMRISSAVFCLKTKQQQKQREI